MSFVSAGMGGTVEEEMDAFKKVIEVVTGILNDEGAKVGLSNGVK